MECDLINSFISQLMIWCLIFAGFRGPSISKYKKSSASMCLIKKKNWIRHNSIFDTHIGYFHCGPVKGCALLGAIQGMVVLCP